MTEPRARARTLTILVGSAAFVVVVAGMMSINGIVGPTFLAVCLTVTVHPLRHVLARVGLPAWAGTVACVLAVYAILLTFAVALVLSGARFAELLTRYEDEFQRWLTDIKDLLNQWGVGDSELDQIFSRLDIRAVAPYVAEAVSSATSVTGNILLILVLLLFMALDGSVIPRLAAKVPERHRSTVDALADFATGTRRYFVVATVFGVLVALADVVLLYALGVPEPWLWGVLSLITGYIPNIGFVLGLVPPALLALFDSGWQTALWVIVGYCVINFVIQSVFQPKIVGDSVGLSATVSMVSLIFWTVILGAWGAILAIPATLLVTKILVDRDPDTRWMSPLIAGREPVA
ncbi:AI-2E family transporter [Mumia zhuanghuii]|uniref:AI-2E family transporter n=1 Tax=Mumia zhuanghuii TaxID=2585211 RepID=A0A5C4MF32_9ACTN|nr:AI-2E family transporter [Mumia zhuanghuii]TNC33679.1 AI-2E family transporter [Mumia zhuanghuii]TNC33943.1 AI-2E family transporter [Mumia zhuanghuii]